MFLESFNSNPTSISDLNYFLWKVKGVRFLLETKQRVFQVKVKPFPRGGDLYLKAVGMLVISLRGVNFGFWSHLGCSGENVVICSREGLI